MKLQAAIILSLICLTSRQAFTQVDDPARTLSTKKSGPWFEIQFLDQETSEPIPIIEVSTVHHARFVSDNLGRVAVIEPDWMNQEIFFYIHAAGYVVPKDGFGFAGKRIKVTPGGKQSITLKRTNLAERLHRITGVDRYRDSQLLGYDIPESAKQNGLVAGQDSVAMVRYRGKLRWFWGDTNRLSYPLGIYRMAGATSEIPAKNADLRQPIRLNYFVDKTGFARNMAELPDPKGVVWLDGVAVVPNETGAEKMVARYQRRNGLAELYDQGMMIYDDQADLFKGATSVGNKEDWRMLIAQPITVHQEGVDWLMFGSPFPVTRVRKSLQHVLDLEQYQSWSCMNPGDNPKTARPLRDQSGRLDYAWRKGPPVTQQIEKRWLSEGLIKPTETRYMPVDIHARNRRIELHNGNTRWNSRLSKWITIAGELNLNSANPSILGEIWLAQSTHPQGPFDFAEKILTHDKQSFYNPFQHEMFMDDDDYLYFQGTLTNSFTNAQPITRVEYNQVQYRLRLDRLASARSN